MNSDQKKIIFVHIPKTGGITFKNMLISNYKESEVVKWQKPECNRTIEELHGFISQGKPLIMGHIDFSLLNQQAFDDYKLICFLRNPIDRTISHYVHFQTSKLEEHQPYKDMPFEEFLQTYAARNWQCQFLSKHKGLASSVDNVDAMLKEALKNLEENIFFCGITEEYDESVIYLRDKIGLTKTKYKYKNRTRKPDLTDELKLNFKKEIAAVNAADIELYEKGKEIFASYKKEVKFYQIQKLRHKWKI